MVTAGALWHSQPYTGLLGPRKHSGFSRFKMWFCHLLRGIQSDTEACTVRLAQHLTPLFSSLNWQV